MNPFFIKKEKITLNEIIKACGIESSYDVDIHDIKPIDKAEENDITFFHNMRYVSTLKATKARAVFVKAEHADMVPENVIAMITKSPYLCLAKTLRLFYTPVMEDREHMIHPTAVVAKTASIAKNVFIGQHAKIGEGTIIEAGAFVGSYVEIGSHCHILANACITNSVIQDHVTIRSNTSIGQAGFGFEITADGAFDVPQIGCVRIGSYVVIGANTCVDRGSLNDTIIGNGCRIDNQVQIAHNDHLGENVLIVSQTGIAGSVEIGSNTIIAGKVGISGHISIGSNVKIAAMSGVMHNIPDNLTIGGAPAQEITKWYKQMAAIKKLGQK